MASRRESLAKQVVVPQHDNKRTADTHRKRTEEMFLDRMGWKVVWLVHGQFLLLLQRLLWEGSELLSVMDRNNGLCVGSSATVAMINI